MDVLYSADTVEDVIDEVSCVPNHTDQNINSWLRDDENYNSIIENSNKNENTCTKQKCDTTKRSELTDIRNCTSPTEILKHFDLADDTPTEESIMETDKQIEHLMEDLDRSDEMVELNKRRGSWESDSTDFLLQTPRKIIETVGTFEEHNSYQQIHHPTHQQQPCRTNYNGIS